MKKFTSSIFSPELFSGLVAQDSLLGPKFGLSFHQVDSKKKLIPAMPNLDISRIIEMK